MYLLQLQLHHISHPFRTFCSILNFSIGSIEEKLISLETARHFRIFFGTLASCSVSGMLRSSFPCKEPIINMFPHIFKHFYLNITGKNICSTTKTLLGDSKYYIYSFNVFKVKVPPEAAIARKDAMCYSRLNPMFTKLSHLPQDLPRVRVSEIHPVHSEPGEDVFSLRRHRYEQVSPVATGMEKVYDKLRL